MKVKASAKPMCEHCYVTTKRNKSGKKTIVIRCMRDPRHKQRQG